MTIEPHRPSRSVTTPFGFETFVVDVSGRTFLRDEDDLYRRTLAGHEVQAGPEGFVLAQMTFRDGRVEMVARDASDAITSLCLPSSTTGPTTLAARWVMFCETALRDHATLRRGCA